MDNSYIEPSIAEKVTRAQIDLCSQIRVALKAFTDSTGLVASSVSWTAYRVRPIGGSTFVAYSEPQEMRVFIETK